jgi:hypothetical protein
VERAGLGALSPADTPITTWPAFGEAARRRCVSYVDKEDAMANRAEITCVAQNGRHSTYERITHVGGGKDKPWKLTIKEAIKLIDSGKWQFFVMRDGAAVKVEALNSRTGCRYLKTANDRYEPHDMLALPACPADAPPVQQDVSEAAEDRSSDPSPALAKSPI